jgi:hypothetical protein
MALALLRFRDPALGPMNRSSLRSVAGSSADSRSGSGMGRASSVTASWPFIAAKNSVSHSRVVNRFDASVT